MRFRSAVLHAALAALVTAPCLAARADAPSAYEIATNPNNIAPTIATAPHRGVEVAGKPRVNAGHPSVTWDDEDIRHYQQMMRTSPELRRVVLDLQEKMDERIARPVAIPPPQKDPVGAWLYPGSYFPAFADYPTNNDDPVVRFSHFFNRDSATVASLGMLYALTGAEKYAAYARELLLAYANLPRYGASPNIMYRWEKGLGGQILEDAWNLQLLSRGFDLVYNSLSPEDRERIHDDLIQPLAWVMLYPTSLDDPSARFASMLNNRGAIGAAAVLMAGYATDDQELVDAALYGSRSTLGKNEAPRWKQFPPAKDWVAATPGNPAKGLLTEYFAPPAIPDGMWVEGAPGYSLYALAALINAAEAAWRHGLDLYGHNDAILKYAFDFPLLIAYPDLSDPAEADSRRLWLSSVYNSTLYEYAWRRYRDPRYLEVINSRAGRDHIAAHRNERDNRNPRPQGARYLVHGWLAGAPPSFLYDLDPHEQAPARNFPSVNFPAVGYGILRATDPEGSEIQSVTLSYGPSVSHGHPDRLHLDLWSRNGILLPSPGVQFPYNAPLDAKWHWTSLAHNTLTVDLTSQRYFAHPPQKETVRADQTVFGPAERMGVERAWSDTAYPGVMMDRSVCLTDAYLADIFAAFSETPHTYDLAWHIRGEPSSGLSFAGSPFPEPVPNGYNAFTSVSRAPPTSGPWSIAFLREGGSARLLAAAGEATQPILGLGGVAADAEPSGRPILTTAPTVIERRENVSSTIFGNALDLSGERTGVVGSVSQEGSRDAGFGLLRIETGDGADLCFASYRRGVHSGGGLETDALQALVRMKGSSPRALYLGGGTSLSAGGAAIRRSEEGLAYLEATPDGGYVLGNPSPRSATITVKLAALNRLEAFEIDAEGRRQAKAAAKAEGDGSIAIRLGAASRVGFFAAR